MHIDLDRMVNQALQNLETDRKRYEAERLVMQAKLARQVEERKLRMAKMQAALDKRNQQTEYFIWAFFALIVITLAFLIFLLIEIFSKFI